MSDDKLTPPGPKSLDDFLRAHAVELRSQDRPPASRQEWDERRQRLRKATLAAAGPTPAKDRPLEPKTLAALERDGHRLEKVIFQSRPDPWVTATAYAPGKVPGKVPAV